MRIKNLNINKQEILKKKFLKSEYKYIIIKSITQSKYIKPKIRNVANFLLLKLSIKERISFQKKVCLILNKHRGIQPKLQLKKHIIKKLNNMCEIPNLIPNKW